MRNVTSIPAPRVSLIDERTGLMSREWYRFFLNLFVLTGSGQSDVTIEDLQKSPSTFVVESQVAVLQTQIQSLQTSPTVASLQDQIAVLQTQIQDLKTGPTVASLQDQIAFLNTAVQGLAVSIPPRT